MKHKGGIAVAFGVILAGLVAYRLYSMYGTVTQQLNLLKAFKSGPAVAVSIVQKRTLQWSFEPVGTV